jgi:transposase
VPIITQFNIETGYCPYCRQYWQARHPEQTSDAIGAAGNTLGPVVLTMAAELKHRLGVSYRKVADFLATYADLHVAPATFVRAKQRLADLARPHRTRTLGRSLVAGILQIALHAHAAMILTLWRQPG